MALHKTIGELDELLTEEEWVFWLAFHQQQPLDDESRIYRPAAYLASRSAGKEAGKAYVAGMDFLAPKPQKPPRAIRVARVIKGN